MKNSLFLHLLFVAVLFSCKKEEEPSTDTKTNVVPFTQMPTTTTSSEQVAKKSPYVTENDKKKSVMYQYKYDVVRNTNSSTGGSVVTPPGMNPPHGQPKHRCDIAVGAPLNSPVAKSPNKTTTAVVTTPTVTATPSSIPSILSTSPEATPTPNGTNTKEGETKN